MAQRLIRSMSYISARANSPATNRIAETRAGNLAGSLIASGAIVATISGMMGALNNNGGNMSNPEEIANREARQCVIDALAAMDALAAALSTLTAVSHELYGAIAALVFSDTWETLAGVVERYQLAQVSTLAVKIANLTGRDAGDVAERVIQWLSSARESGSFADCMLTLEAEAILAEIAGAGAFRFAFDLMPEREG